MVSQDIISGLDFNMEGGRIAMIDCHGYFSISDVDSGTNMAEAKFESVFSKLDSTFDK